MGTAGVLCLAVAAGVRSGPADGFLVLAGLAALTGGVALAAWLSPALTISAGLILSLASGRFGDLGSPIGLDRVVIVAGVLAVVVRELRSPTARLRVRGIDLWLAGILLIAAVSAYFAGTWRQNGPFFALVDNLGVVPFLLFWVAPAAFGTPRERRLLLCVLTGVGAYLGITALAETLNWNWAIFPRYILDPTVGLHYGRARGPFAEAAANGLSMFFCAVAAAVLLATDKRRHVLLATVIGLCGVGIVFALTRQVWLAAGLGTLIAMLAQRRLRVWVLPTFAAAGVAVFVIFATVPGFNSRAEDRVRDQRPVWDRLNSNAATWRMLAERPLTGYGWGGYRENINTFFRLAPDRAWTGAVSRPHNVFLANGAELGALVLVAWIAALAIAIGGALRRRGPPDLGVWRAGLIAVAIGWLVVANFTPMYYAFCHSVLWLWAGICWSRT
ncbi:O-antigen ligase family protein [Solirubrobacter deserti]|uniref:O-antigen ligase family protein n=1 Tax=Solirubrobacter deserti TaxID=2282478 RepID=A0ABT4RMY2_9ACTN|nr:O-antigen ligase family protein [Solirubrobacter deserti]MDA0139645.1 O-antigen ligase family protein [Solirubrobacter deserti]